jgi:2-polyprenyl-3-methyl-5-hydroxy-6-metoxy-1,4-benzoquinol methylase
MNKSHLTAMSRKTLSAPMKWMEGEGFFDGVPRNKCLDYGCGKGFDADTLGFQKYDPHFFPCDGFRNVCFHGGEFDVITCNFVLNVIPNEEKRKIVLENIEYFLAPSMSAFISIRSDKKDLKGITRRGTYQGYHPPALPLIHKGSGYEIYQLKKD